MLRLLWRRGAARRDGSARPGHGRAKTASLAAAIGTAAIAVMYTASSGCSSSDDALGGAEGPTPYASAEGGADAGVPPPTVVTFVHASADLGDIRLCWSIDGQLTDDPPFPVSPPMPASNYPGIPQGGAVRLDDAAAFASAKTITLTAIDANMLARTELSDGVVSCAMRLANDAAHSLPLSIVHPLPSIAGLVSGSTTVLAVTGCAPGDDTVDAEGCGADWSIAGNLHALPLHVVEPGDVSAGSDGGLPLQAALLSPGIAQALGGANVALSFGPSGDAGAVAQLLRADDLEPGAPVQVAVGMDLGANLAAFGQLGFAIDAPGEDDAGVQRMWMSLATSQALVDPSQDPRTFFGAGSTYVVAIVGDPALPSPFFTGDAGEGDASYDGRALHVLVLPSRPPPLDAGR